MLQKIIKKISRNIPFQVMRFMAVNDKLSGLGPTREQGEQLCIILRQILEHVYLFNTPGNHGTGFEMPCMWEYYCAPCLFRSDGGKGYCSVCLMEYAVAGISSHTKGILCPFRKKNPEYLADIDR